MKSVNNKFANGSEMRFKASIFDQSPKGHFLLLDNIWLTLNYDDQESITDQLCEAIRRNLYNANESKDSKTPIYFHPDTTILISWYQMPDTGHFNMNEPMLINNWESYGLK